MNRGRNKARNAAFYGMMCAQAIAISALEGMLPSFIPVPGARLGLSNIVTMFCVSSVSLPCAITVTVFKALFALLTRGATAAVLSLSGGMLSLAVMFLCFRFGRSRLGLLGTGVLSAVAHNAGQLGAACVILSDSLYGLIGILTLSSVVTGLLTGSVLKAVLPLLNKQFNAFCGSKGKTHTEER